ncbi:MAG: hypothetical protein WC867_00645 [Candidatus Pacearchaeota archaeon]|jgi:hypothetical protein
MRTRKIDKILENRIVFLLFKDMDLRLQTLPLNGASIHKRESVRCAYVFRMDRYEMGSCPLTETFGDLKERDKSDYDSCVRLIEETKKYFKLNP